MMERCGHSCNILMTIFAIVLILGSMAVVNIGGDQSDATYDTTETHTITFYGNSGTADGDSSRTYTVHEDQSIELPVTMFTRDGYYLKAWHLGSTSGTSYDPGYKFTVTSDASFYAEWGQLSGRHVTDYYPDSGEYLEFNLWDIANSEEGLTGQVTIVNMPDWMGWNESVNNSCLIYGNITQPGVYLVEWTMKWFTNPTTLWFVIVLPSAMDTECTVSFDLNGGSAASGSSLPSKSGPVGTTITLYDGDDVSYNGHTLLGWRISIDGQEATFPANGEYTMNIDRQNITATAQWLASSYAIVYNPLNAPGVEGVSASYGDVLTLKETPGEDVEIPEGYHFGGWVIRGNEDVVLAPGMGYRVTGQFYLGGYWVDNSAESYTVNFDANGGTPSLSVEVEAGDAVYLPQDGMERAGYTFAGWSTTKSGSDILDDETWIPESDGVTLYAQWVQNIFPVTDINITGSSVVSVGQSITIEATSYPSTADDRGVRFSLMDGTGSARISSQDTTSTGGYAVIIGLSPGTVTLIASSVDGSGYSESKTLTVLGETSTHTRTIIYDPNGGSWIGDAPNETVNTGTASSYTFTITTMKPVQTGYTFLGWAVEGSNVPQYGYQSNQLTELTVYEDVTTLHAIWEENINTFSLTYDANEGLWPDTYESTYTDSRGSDGNSYEFTVRSEQPVYLGYLFLGWSSEKITPGEGTVDDVEYEAGSKIDVSDSKTIYAVWGDNRCTYVLKFDANGGTWPNGEPSPLEELTAATYWTFTIPSDEDYIPTLAGRTFVGWSVNGSGIISEDDVVYSPGDIVVFYGTSGQTSEIILMAVWGDGKDSHTLTFDGNGGEGDVIEGVPDPKVEPTDSEGWSHFTLPSEEPTRVGADGTVYIFNGWDTDEKALNGGYDSSQAVSSANDFTLYAIWSVGGSMVSVTFFPNVSDTSVTEMPDNMMGQILEGEDSVEIQIPDTEPKRDGYNFIGWANDPGSDNVYCSPGQLIPVSEDLDLFAIWRAVGESTDTFDVVFNSNGGTPVTSQSIASGGHAERPEDPVREGYTFDGWMLDGKEFDFENTPITSDITLMAAWTDGSGGGQDGGDDDDDTGGGNDAVIWILVAICLILFIVILVRR